MTPKQKLIILLGAIGFIVFGICAVKGKVGSPGATQADGRRQTEKLLQNNLKPVIHDLKTKGKANLGKYELTGTHVGGTNFTDVTLTEKKGTQVLCEYEASSMKVTFSGAKLTEGTETIYEGGQVKETNPFDEKTIRP